MPECYFCESQQDIEEHHILPQRFNGSDAKTNIVDVCHDCHWKLERLYNKDFWNALGIEDPRATKEKHIICEHHSCSEPAKHDVRTQGIVTRRCDEHRSNDNIEDKDLRILSDGKDKQQ